jgi:hypothetical protein
LPSVIWYRSSYSNCCLTGPAGRAVGDNRNEDDSDNGVLGVSYKWSRRGIEYLSPARKDTFS